MALGLVVRESLWQVGEPRRGGGGDWPDEDQWKRLTEHDRAPEVPEIREVAAPAGRVSVEVDLEMPAAIYVELVPC